MRWDSDAIEKYTNILTQPEIVDRLKNFNDTTFLDSDSAASDFSEIMNDVLARVFSKSKSKRRHKIFRQDYSHICQIAKRKFKQAQRKFNRDKACINRRHNFIEERRNYRRAVYQAKKVHKENKINDLLQLEKLDVKSFWKG